MLAVLFSAGPENYACDCLYVQEVFPLAKLKEIARVPDYVAGLMSLAEPFPVIDFRMLTQKQPSEKELHTRIIKLEYQPENGPLRRLGIIGEKITKTAYLESNNFRPIGLRVESLPFLDGIQTINNNTIQLVDVIGLFSFMEPLLS